MTYEFYGGISPHVADSDTSIRAAIEALEDADTQRGEVWRFLVSRKDHGATDEEIQIALKMNPSTERPRRVELVAKSLVADGAIRRKTSSGRWAVVWVARKREEP